MRWGRKHCTSIPTCIIYVPIILSHRDRILVPFSQAGGREELKKHRVPSSPFGVCSPRRLSSPGTRWEGGVHRMRPRIRCREAESARGARCAASQDKDQVSGGGVCAWGRVERVRGREPGARWGQEAAAAATTRGARCAASARGRARPEWAARRAAGARSEDVTSGGGPLPGEGRGLRLVQPRGRKEGLPGAPERERVPEQYPRVPARLRGLPAPGGRGLCIWVRSQVHTGVTLLALPCHMDAGDAWLTCVPQLHLLYR